MKKLCSFVCCLLPAVFLFPLFSLTSRAQMQYPLTDHISSYHISSFAEDAQGYIWIGTNHGLNRYSGSNYAVHYSQKDSFSLNNDNISSLLTDRDGNLWISTECGLCVWKEGRFRHPENSGFNIIPRIVELDRKSIVVSDRRGVAKIDKATFSEEARFCRPGLSLVKPLIVSSAKQVWVANAKKDATLVYILDADLQMQQILACGNDAVIRDITEDREGLVWVVTDNGLCCYEAKSLRQQEIPDGLQQLCRQGKVHFLKSYKPGCLLIGLAGKGMLCYDKRRNTLTPLHRQQRLQEESYVCFVDSHANIWLSDKKTGVRFYSDKVLHETITSVQDVLADPFIKNVSVDRENYLWIRTTRDVVCYDLRNDRVAFRMPGDHVYGCLFIDSKNDLWIITDYAVVNQYAVAGGKPVLKRSIPFQSNVFSVSEDKTGKIWVTLTDKFALIDPAGNIAYKYAPEGISFSMLYTVFPSRKMFLYTIANGIYEFGDDRQFIPLDAPVTSPNCIHIDRKNAYWIGTYNAGLTYYDPTTRQVRQFDVSSGLVDNNLKSIVEDREGNIWFSTSTHITKYDVHRNSFSYFYDNHFINGKLYAVNCATAAPDGTLYFGGSGGVTVVYPDKQENGIADIPLNFDVILVNGKVCPGVRDNIELNYKENMLTFWYSGLNFESGASLNYAYCLDGFDDRWIDAGNNQRVAYSNLPAGHYTFRVKVRKLNGEWSRTELKLPIRIKPAPWLSPWAVALYWTMGISLFCFAVWLVIRWKVQKEKLRLSERQKELTQAHIDFVTNISHEFRTPLSLIWAPLKELVYTNRMDEADRKLLTTIQRNTDRLMQLTEQILHVDRCETEERKLQVGFYDLPALLHSWIDNFGFVVRGKEITLDVRCPEGINGYFDREKVEKICCNLIGNALKYTPQKGRVEVNVIRPVGQPEIRIEVKDTGIGIPAEKREDIFKRFERLDADKTSPAVAGSGVGLHYAQQLAHWHKGHIAYSPNFPCGSCFTLTLPFSETAYTREEITPVEAYPPLLAREIETEVPDSEKNGKEHTLLVVEDNDEVRAYLQRLMAGNYNVMVEQDGEKALARLLLNPPDLILSDVVMPRMDGFEFCKTVKESPDYGHIPVVLLTAKTDLANSIKGLDCGADAYVNKPFDPFYLKAVVENLIANRKRIQRIVLNLTSATLEGDDTQDIVLTEHDRLFLENLHLQMDEHLGDEAFTINKLAKGLGVSYSSLYARIKSLTGQTPQTFFITYRMNVAMELLKTKKYTVGEVCYKVGASSVSNFSRSFKRQFGVPPSAV